MNKNIIKLQLPKKAEYIPVARLAISGIAYGENFDIENIEDLKVCLGEACINALALSLEDEISMEFEVNEDRIYIRVRGVKNTEEISLEGSEELRLGMLIIESLMDKVIIDENGIEMIKYIEADIK